MNESNPLVVILEFALSLAIIAILGMILLYILFRIFS